MQQLLADPVRSKYMVRRTVELLVLGSQGGIHQGRRVRGPSLRKRRLSGVLPRGVLAPGAIKSANDSETYGAWRHSASVL